MLCAVLGIVGSATAVESAGRNFETLFAIRMLAAPVAVEFLSLSTFDHDTSLVAYLQKFRSSAWPDLSHLLQSENALYILRSPFTDKVYAGRTVNFRRRHTDHFHRIDNPSAAGQIPAYHVIRNLAGSFRRASCFHVLHVACCASGRGSEGCSYLGASLHPWLGFQTKCAEGLPPCTLGAQSC